MCGGFAAGFLNDTVTGGAEGFGLAPVAFTTSGGRFGEGAADCFVTPDEGGGAEGCAFTKAGGGTRPGLPTPGAISGAPGGGIAEGG